MGRRGEPPKCFLCYSTVIINDNPDLNERNQFFGVSGQLVKEMTIIFIIRKVLSIPKSVCYKLVETVGDPSSWGIKFCSKCLNLINETQLLSERVEHYNQKLLELSTKIQLELFQNFKTNKRLVQSASGKSWETVDELRFQFSKEFSKAARTTKSSIVATDVNEAKKGRNEMMSKQSKSLSFPTTEKSDRKLEFSTGCLEEGLKEIKFESNSNADIEQNQTYFSDEESFVWNDIPEQPASESDDSSVCINDEFGDFSDSSENRRPKKRKLPTTKKNSSLKVLGGEEKSVKKIVSKVNDKKVETTESKTSSNLNAEKPVDAKELKKFICTEDKCKKRYATEADLDIHVKKVHKGDMRPHECSVCSKKFSIRSSLVAHLKVHEKKKSNPVPAQPAPIVNYSCDVCQKSFKSKGSLHSHMKTSVHLVGPKPFMCELCSKTFQSSLYLTQHQQLFHYELLNLEPIKCKECGKLFAKERSLNWHIKSTHQKEYKFRCSLCPTGFEYENSLVIHMRVHTGERPFKCSLCPKSFAIRYRLTSHMRVHTGEKPYKCIECGRMFSDKPTFNRHIEGHKGILHDCSVCSRQYPTRYALHLHMKKHEGKKQRVQRRKRLSGVRNVNRNVGGTTSQLTPMASEESADSNSIVIGTRNDVSENIPAYRTRSSLNQARPANVDNFVDTRHQDIYNSNQSYPAALIPQNNFSTYAALEEHREMPHLLPFVP